MDYTQDEYRQIVMEAITAAIRGNKRPTIGAMLGRKHILKRLEEDELNGLIQKLVNDGKIAPDNSKRKPAYYHTGGW